MSSPQTTSSARQVLPQIATPTVIRWFKIVAVAEAISWALLLFGMFMKYLASDPTPIFVSIFGALHGGIFILFVLISLLAWNRLRWTLGTLALALIAAIPPFFTVLFEVWASRTGRLSPDPAPAID